MAEQQIETNNQSKKKMSFFKKLDLFRNILFLLVYIGMLTFNVLYGKANAKLNMWLIIITAVYLVLFIFLTIAEVRDNKNKQIKKTVKVVYKVFKKSMLLISTVLTVGAVFAVKNEMIYYKLPMMIFTIFNLSFQIFLTIVISILTNKVKKQFVKVKENVKLGLNEINQRFRKTEDESVKEIAPAEDKD